MGLTCDYLIVGAGVQGLAFTDALLKAKKGCRVIIVDNRSNPGGYWNDIYAFARLDEPNIFYGVPRLRLEDAKLNSTGKLSERASRDQILSYFNCVMEYLIKTGNVQYFPNCMAQNMGTGFGNTTVCLTPCFKLDGVTKKRIVTVYGKVVYSPNATIQTSLPSCVSSFQIDTGVCIVRPHELTYNRAVQHPMYVVIGSGRTGIDTILWLLSHQIPAQTVHWVMPRDSWFHSCEPLESMFRYFLKVHELVANAPSIEALFLAFEQAKLLCRIDEQRFPEISPSLHLSEDDLTALRTVHNIIRLGHVRKITTERLELDKGNSKICEGALCIDCTSQFKKCEQENVPVFSKFQIALQPFSEVWGNAGEQNVSFHAAFIGFLESFYPGDEETKNSLCTPINFPDHHTTYFNHLLMHYKTLFKVFNDKKMFSLMLGPPGRLSAMIGGDIRKFGSKENQALIESSRENLAKILHAKDSIPAPEPNSV